MRWPWRRRRDRRADALAAWVRSLEDRERRVARMLDAVVREREALDRERGEEKVVRIATRRAVDAASLGRPS